MTDGETANDRLPLDAGLGDDTLMGGAGPDTINRNVDVDLIHGGQVFQD